MELYYPNSEYDLETIGQLSFSFFSTVFIAVLVYYTCSTDKNPFGKTRHSRGVKKGPSTQVTHSIVITLLNGLS